MSPLNTVAAIFLAALAAGVFIAINSYETPPAEVRRVDLSTDDLEIMIQRTACFGPCPIYTVYVRGDGSVSFVGQDYTDVIGSVDDTLTDEQLFQIAFELDRSRFFDVVEIDECEELWTDASSVMLWIKWQGKERRVERYLGCKKRPPDPAPALSRRIDEIINTAQWIGDWRKKWP